MSHALIAAFCLAWVCALWWAIRRFGPFGGEGRSRPDGEPARVAEPVSRTWPVLFILSHLLLLAGVVIRLRYGPGLFSPFGVIPVVLGEVLLLFLLLKCGTETDVEPRLIDLSIQHNIQTDPEYERVVLWRRANGLFENRSLTTLAGLLATAGGLGGLTAVDGAWFIGAFGLNLLLSLWITFRYTTLAIRPGRVTLHRWLTIRPVRELSMRSIASVEVRSTAPQRLFSAARLRVRDADGRSIQIVLSRARETALLINRLRARLDPSKPRPRG